MGATALDRLMPDTTFATGAWMARGGPALIHECLANEFPVTNWASMDNTTVIFAAGDFRFKVGLEPVVVPAGNKVKFIRVVAQLRQTAAVDQYTVRVDVITPAGQIPLLFSGISNTSTFSSLSVTIAYAPGGGEWTEETINEIVLKAAALRYLGGTVLEMGSLFVDVFVNRIPVVIPSGVGTVTTTSYPDLLFTYSDPDGDLQEMVEAKIFSGAGAVADPSTEVVRLISHLEPTYTDETTITSIGLPNGAYRWAVRAKDAGAGNAEDDWSAWAQVSFWIDNPAPVAPTLIVTPDSTNNLHTITVASGGGANPPERFYIERSDDKGVTWVPVRDGSFAATGIPQSIFDHEAPRMAQPYTPGTFSTVAYNDPIPYNDSIPYNSVPLTLPSGVENVVRYRAQASRVVSGETMLSPFSEVTPDSLVGNATTWLKHPYDPGKSLIIQHMANWETTSDEELVALQASGRRDWVVIGDVPSFEKGEIELVFAGDEAWINFEDLRCPAEGVAASPLLLQTCFGDTVLHQMWVRLGPTRSLVHVTHRDQNVLQYRRAKVGFYETIRPLVD